jgi:hypothetical protein
MQRLLLVSPKIAKNINPLNRPIGVSRETAQTPIFISNMNDQ